MSDLFGAAAPPPAPARRRAAAAPAPRPAGAAQPSRPAAPLQVAQEQQPEPPPAPQPQALRGRLVTLADGRQVDSWSDEWRMECFARHLLALAPQARNEWMHDLLQRYGEEGVAPIREAMDSVREAAHKQRSA